MTMHARCFTPFRAATDFQQHPASRRATRQTVGRSSASTIVASGGFNVLKNIQQAFGGSNSQGSPSPPSTSPSTPPPSSPKVVFPPYTVVKKGAVYDLRLYDPYPVVEVEYRRRDEGFLSVGGYFDGSNAAGVRFPQSQPVMMRYETQGRKAMQLYIAAAPGSTAADLPVPTDPEVRLKVAGGELLAVLPFEGNITPASAEQARQQLLTALQADGLQLAEDEAAGLFRVAQYGQLFQLSARLNEMMLRVKL